MKNRASTRGQLEGEQTVGFSKATITALPQSTDKHTRTHTHRSLWHEFQIKSNRSGKTLESQKKKKKKDKNQESSLLNCTHLSGPGAGQESVSSPHCNDRHQGVVRLKGEPEWSSRLKPKSVHLRAQGKDTVFSTAAPDWENQLRKQVRVLGEKRANERLLPFRVQPALALQCPLPRPGFTLPTPHTHTHIHTKLLDSV